MSYIFILCLFLLITSSLSKLELLIEYSRHGARSPENFNHPDIFPEGQKKVTAEGLHQHFLIGCELRKRYIEELHYLPETITIPDSLVIKVYASSLVRTYSSAVSQLLGLYPDGTGPLIFRKDLERIKPPINLTIRHEIHNEDFHDQDRIAATLHGVGVVMIITTDRENDLFFQGYDKRYCPIVEQIFSEKENSPKNKQLLEEWKANLLPPIAEVLKRDWNETLDIENADFSTMKDLYDLWTALNFHKRGGIELNLDQDLLYNLSRAYFHVMNYRFEGETLALKASLSLLIEDISLKMMMKVKRSTIPEFNDLKFAFYSGRDGQLHALMNILLEIEDRIQLKDKGIIPFSSIFLIELHEDDERQGSWFVKVWLNDEPLKMKCGEEVGVCELQRFLDLLKIGVSDNIYRDCGINKFGFLYK